MRVRREISVRQRQSGVIAILFAVLIAALAAIYATNMAWDSALDARRSTNIGWREQAVQAALGAETWTSDILKLDASETETDHLGESWALELPPFPFENDAVMGDVAGGLSDAQGLFNVNNLVDSSGKTDDAAVKQFERLLVALEIDPKYAGISADWIDSNLEPGFPNGAEDPIYTGMNPPYRTANLPLSDASELAAIAEMEPDVYARLKPHIIALPGATTLNVNTASAVLLQSIDERIDASEAERLIAERGEGGFTDFQAAFQSLVDPDFLPRLGEITNYFRLKTVVRVGSVRVTMYSLLYRGQQGATSPILRTFGSG